MGKRVCLARPGSSDDQQGTAGLVSRQSDPMLNGKPLLFVQFFQVSRNQTFSPNYPVDRPRRAANRPRTKTLRDVAPLCRWNKYGTIISDGG
jgi:hypothetical protein